MIDNVPPQIISRADAKEAGLKRYFTGNPCKHWHIAERRVGNRQCVECGPLRYAENSEMQKQRVIRWRTENVEHVREYNARRHAENREINNKRSAQWHATNRSHRKEYDARRNAENPARQKEAAARWCAENQDKILAYNRNRRARMQNSDGTHTADDVSTIRAAQKDKCAYCGIKLNGKGHLDHIMPLARGGSNWPSNLQLLCQKCNQKKHASDPIEFAKRIGKLL